MAGLMSDASLCASNIGSRSNQAASIQVEKNMILAPQDPINMETLAINAHDG